MKHVMTTRHRMTLSPGRMHACAEELALIAQQYSPSLQGQNIELRCQSLKGLYEVSVIIHSENGQEQRLLKLSLSGNPPKMRDLGVQLGLAKA